MACTLVITTAVINSSTGNIIVNGTYSETPVCNPGTFTINVKVICGSFSCGGNGHVVSGTNEWTADFPCNCPCGSPVTIDAAASCSNPAYNCVAMTLSMSTLCCCPTALTQMTFGSCDSSATAQLVTFDTFVTIPDFGCTFTFRRNFGDGFFGALWTFTGVGTFPIPSEMHYYAAPGTYTSTVEVVGQPIGCNVIDSQQVVISCAGCYTNAVTAGICKFLEWFFLVFAVAGFGGLFGLTCWPIFVPLIYLAVALVGFLFYRALKCEKCTCGHMQKFLGQIYFAIGLVILMYVLPSCSVLTLIPAIIMSSVFLALGYLILWTWYTSNKLTCPLLICDFWCALAGPANIRSATNIALAAGIILYLTNIVLLAGLGIMGAAIAIIAVFVIMGPLNPSTTPCDYHHPSCT